MMAETVEKQKECTADQSKSHSLKVSVFLNKKAANSAYSIDADELKEHIEVPQRTNAVDIKSNAQMIIACNSAKRTADVVKQMTSFWLLRLDFDKLPTTATPQVIHDALAAEIGCCWTHTTASHTASAPCVRVYIPLSQPVDCQQWQLMQGALSNKALEVLAPVGVTSLDECANSPSQPMFLPLLNKDIANTYEHYICGDMLPSDHWLYSVEPVPADAKEDSSPPPPAKTKEKKAKQKEVATIDDDGLAQAVKMQQAQQALTKLDPDADYAQWVKIAMAIKSEFGADGFALFDEWSQRGEKYDAKIVRDKYDGLEPNNTTIGTLFFLANGGKSKSSFPDIDICDNGKVNVLNTCDNLSAMINGMGLTAARNTMSLALELLNENGHPVADDFDGMRSILVSEAAKRKLPRLAIDDHLTAVCNKAKFHPVAVWLEQDNARWDGVPRVQQVIDCMNASDKDLARVIMQKWLIAAIAALYEPRFTCKLVMVLQGDQSFKKTAFLSRVCNVLSGAFLEGAELDPDNKDSVLQAIAAWVVELGELERTSKNSQGALKAFITNEVDRVRPPYARAAIDKKRQTIFAATVNGHGFLRDESGSSRYGVIELGSAIDIERVNAILGYKYKEGRLTLEQPELLRQFWLEVKAAYDKGMAWTLTEQELAQIARVNSKFDYKDDTRTLLEDAILPLLDTDKSEWRWLRVAEILEAIPAIRPEKRVLLGKALSAMCKEGLIQSRTGRSRTVLYNLPKLTDWQFMAERKAHEDVADIELEDRY